MTREKKKEILLVLLIVVPVFLFFFLAYYTHRNEPAVITRMHWVYTRAIEESRDTTTHHTDSKGNSYTTVDTHWYEVCKRTKSGNRTQKPQWPKIREAGWGERLVKNARHYVNSESKIDLSSFRYCTGSLGKWLKFNISDEILVSVSFNNMVWGIEPYTLE